MKLPIENRAFSKDKVKKLENQLRSFQILLVLAAIFGLASLFLTADWRKILGSLAVLCLLMSLARLLEFYKEFVRKENEENGK